MVKATTWCWEGFHDDPLSNSRQRRGKHLISTVNSGKTARRAMECIEYYGGSLQGIAAVFSAIAKVDEVPVMSIFSPEDIPGYMTSLVPDCPLCRAGQKIDALANSYGFSVLK